MRSMIFPRRVFVELFLMLAVLLTGHSSQLHLNASAAGHQTLDWLESQQ